MPYCEAVKAVKFICGLEVVHSRGCGKGMDEKGEGSEREGTDMCEEETQKKHRSASA